MGHCTGLTGTDSFTRASCWTNALHLGHLALDLYKQQHVEDSDRSGVGGRRDTSDTILGKVIFEKRLQGFVVSDRN